MFPDGPCEKPHLGNQGRHDEAKHFGFVAMFVLDLFAFAT